MATLQNIKIALTAISEVLKYKRYVCVRAYKVQ